MSRDDRDRPDLLEAEAPVTPAEQARAEAFGRWLDGLAAGEPLPPAMDSDDRAMLETATMVLASSRAVELGPERTRRLVDQALENAVLGRRPSEPGLLNDAGGPAGKAFGSTPGETRGARVSALRRPAPVKPAVEPGRDDRDDRAAQSSTDLVRARRRRAERVVRNLPWAVASIAAVAAVVLFVTRPVEPPGIAERAVERPLRLGVANTSRPADPLIGIIARPDAGRASERLDVLFADRMDGYRDLMFRRALGKEQP